MCSSDLKVVQLDYTWERREELIRKEEYEEGLEDGRQQGIQQGIQLGVSDGMKTVFDILQKLKQGVTLKELVDQGFDEEVVKRAQMLMK